MKQHDIVLRVNPAYVGNSCVQIMMPYRENITVVNTTNILFHHTKDKPILKNDYLYDIRRREFPYFAVPYHKDTKWFTIYNYANQLLNYNVPYVRVSDGAIMETIALKDGNGALVYNKFLTGTKDEYETDRDGLYSIFDEDHDRVYYLNLDGTMNGAYDSYELLGDEDSIIKKVQQRIVSQINNYMSSDENYFDDISLQCIVSSINRLSFEDLPENINIIKDLLVVRLKRTEIQLDLISVDFISKDKYKITDVNIPVNKYNLEEVKSITNKIIEPREPRFPEYLNKHINRESVDESRALALMKNSQI